MRRNDNRGRSNDGSGRRRGGQALTRARVKTGNELVDGAKNTGVDLFLILARLAQLSFPDAERMVAAFDDMEIIFRRHFLQDIFEQVERTKRVAASLNEKDRSAQVPQHFVAQFLRIAP